MKGNLTFCWVCDSIGARKRGEIQMKKKILQEYDFRNSIKISETPMSAVFRLNNGSILKIYNPDFIYLQKKIGVDVEAKILDAVPLKMSPEILIPTSAVYTKDGTFAGYIMPSANGIDYNSYDAGLTISQRKNLSKYADVHHKLESVLRRNTDIVFPDFCTCDNIFIDRNGKIQFIDYDGLQVGKHKSISVSSSIGGGAGLTSKYYTKNMYFTKELDKKSSIFLYYLTAFNIDLNKVGTLNPFTGQLITVEDIFQCINLDDPDLCHKTYKIFQDDQANEYLGDDVFRIAEKYDVEICEKSFNNTYLKKLIKKK